MIVTSILDEREAEMAVELARKKDMSVPAVLRQALRAWHAAEAEEKREASE